MAATRSLAVRRGLPTAWNGRMNPTHSLVGVALAVVMAAGVSERAGAQTPPGECIDYSPLGFCLEWEVPGSPGFGNSRPSRGGDGPDCYWVILDRDISAGDPGIFVDYGL